MKLVLDQNDHKKIEELLTGRMITSVINHDTMVLDNGVKVEVIPNDGCCGCASGDYHLDELNECEAVITSVRLEDQEVDGEDAHVYKIFVLAANKERVLLSVSGDDGNGYYGTGYRLRVIINP